MDEMNNIPYMNNEYLVVIEIGISIKSRKRGEPTITFLTIPQLYQIRLE